MAVVEIVVSAMFKEVLDKLVSEGVKQFMKLVNKGKNSKNKIKIEEWKVKLETIQAVLSDAEQKQCYEENGDTIRLWLENLQDRAFDLEDLLDDFAYEALKMTQGSNDDFDVNHLKKSARGFLPTSFHNMVGSVLACGCSSTRQIGYSGPDFSSRIDQISKDMNEIHSRFSTLGLSPNNLGLPTKRKTPETSSLISEPHVYGRNDRKKDIICQLLEDKSTYKNYVVIPIVGMGGIGKTTLAQYVYNDEKVKGHFDRKAWVCVSDVFDVKRITIDIINSATAGSFGCNNLNEAQQKLQEVVKDKKIFVVLDDVWCNVYEEWNRLQTPFLGAARGSRVIVTTRIEDTAMVMNNHFPNTIIHLERLSGEYCWSIFQQHVNTMDPDLAERRDDIIRKCDGLPLAAKALGGLLKTFPDKSERRKILESNVWGEESTVLPVLRLSYHHMPSHLKRVFAYCSVFPKDYRFKEMEVILLWMAQGFIPESQNERMEDMGHKYINDLVSRSLLEKSMSDAGEFIMHDLIHDLAQLAAGEVCYVADADTQINGKRIRHLFITEHVQTLGSEIMVPQLRTFLCKYGLKIDYSDFFKKIRYIRILFLYSYEIEALPECIGDLKHLCYLSLKFESIKVLPQSISKLWNLQTLCLEGCYKLEEVPCIELLGKLRHLYFSYESLKKMPRGIGKLTNLQTLNRFVLAAGGGSWVRELGKLNHLRGSLSISGLENVIEIEDAQEAQLCKKESLDSLYLAWGTCTDEVDDKTMRDVVEKLKPHTSIKECKLIGYMGLTFPNWLGDLSYNDMVYIELVKCEKCERLPPLGNLPSLRSLIIEDMNGIKEVGLEFYGHCSTPFPSLETLSFLRMKSWEKWVHPPVDNNKAFPILEKLYILCCPSLRYHLPTHLLETIQHQRVGTCSYVYEDDIIGRKPDLDKIVGVLLDSNVQQNVSFLSIVGIGGLGKTALAQLLYNDARLKSAFSLKLWTCVADDGPELLDVQGVLERILAEATGYRMNEGFTMNELQKKLREQLAGKKYLLFLDDVCTEDYERLHILKQYLMGGQKGSWIVVTTRSHRTAAIIRDGPRYDLQGLSKEDSLCLFKRVAFGSQHSNPPEDLVKIGEDIVEKCAGVPLSIRVVGSLLYGQERNKWLSFRNLGLAEVKESQISSTTKPYSPRFTIPSLEGLLKYGKGSW